MPSLTINNANYHYTQTGNGEPLLLLHGFTGSGDNWREHVSPFAEQFSVLTIDILGHGRSSAPSDPDRYSMEAVSADLVAMLDALEIERCHLLGYSMGGRLALFTAVHHPNRVRSLILESSSPGLASAAEQQARTQRDNDLADWIKINGIEAFVNRWEALPLWESQKQLSPEKRNGLRQQRLQNSTVGLSNSLRGMGTGVQPSLWGNLPALQMPVLQIVGALDNKFVSINEKMGALLPNSQLEIMPNAGHTVHLERPLSYQSAIRRFLP